MKKLLVVAHCPSPNTQSLINRINMPNNGDVSDGVNLCVVSPFSVDSQAITAADGILLFTPENFGYMSGALKDCFDRLYNPCQGLTQGKPYCLCVRAGLDGTGAVTSVERIVKGLEWKKAQAPLVLKGDYCKAFEQQFDTYWQTMAAGLELGIY